jgi:hypothetical protein
MHGASRQQRRIETLRIASHHESLELRCTKKGAMNQSDARELDEAVKPEVLAAYVRRKAPALRRSDQAHHVAMESVRTATYEGRSIVIRTTYAIEIDGVPLEGHIAVANDGEVHYHPIPNLSYPSAVDMVQRIIDTFPDEFPRKRRRAPRREEGGHSGHPT